MSMERLCLIICSICVIAVPSRTHENNTLLLHSPPDLHVWLGGIAIFTCNLTALNFTPKDVNWYKGNRTQSTKIADVKYADSNRLNITKDWEQKIAVLHIQNVTLNDSGQYYCGHVNVEGNGQIFISNTSDLTVNNVSYSATTGPDQTKKGPTDNNAMASRQRATIATSILLVLLLLLLIGITTFIVWYRQRNKMPHPQLRHLEKPPQDANVYTVDYGVLDFGNNQPSRKSAEISIQEQVEYATIMFP
ncbi:PREDICTED: programmed cell death protein 1 [Nanorana parkeri]|uniref:programmed cell death protein 1 n=1 Tax=Nanorana parkeri TaxID=125878 RepID=UPI000854B19C|nr:PREDICTED: programmed cell death protein 1 [Nanorana parkeri]